MNPARSSLAATLLALCVSLAPACKKETPPPPPSKPIAAPAPSAAAPVAAPVAPAAPIAAPAAPAPPTVTDPKWIAGLPVVPVTAKPGDVVYATAPVKGNEQSKLALYNVVSVNGSVATLELPPFGEKAIDVPGALIHPVSTAPVKVGDVAMGYTMFGTTLGRVSKIEGPKTFLRFHWINEAKEMEARAVMAIPAGVAPLGWVHHKGDGLVTTRYVGTVVAQSPERVWVIGASAHVVSSKRTDVMPMTVKTEYTVGQKVLIDFPGLQEATVSKVVTPGLLYETTREFMGKPMKKVLSVMHITEKL